MIVGLSACKASPPGIRSGRSSTPATMIATASCDDPQALEQQAIQGSWGLTKHRPTRRNYIPRLGIAISTARQQRRCRRLDRQTCIKTGRSVPPADPIVVVHFPMPARPQKQRNQCDLHCKSRVSPSVVNFPVVIEQPNNAFQGQTLQAQIAVGVDMLISPFAMPEVVIFHAETRRQR